MDKLLEARSKIDTIDEQIMDLLEERYYVSKEVGRIKEEIKKEVLDNSREQIIFDKTSKYSHSPQIIEVYKTIMNESKKLQRK